MFQYQAKVMRIIDGDTLILDIDLGFKVHTEIDCRLAHVNTPETAMYSINGIVDPAKSYVNQCVPPGSVCIANISRAEKYGRWLAEIWFMPGVVDRENILREHRVLNDELLKEGLAQAYEGGKK